MKLFNEITIDAFAGGGGASTGIEQAFADLGLDAPVTIAVNHDAQALAMHAANHPDTVHVREDVFDADMREMVGKRMVRLLWMSPDCKHFSKAKGGKPVEKKIRGLAWIGVKWAKQLRPRQIILENVEEFRDWGPLKRIDGAWFPDPERKGLTFQKFVGQLRRLGYKVEHRTLRACDYGAPTIRRRLILIARCDGQAIVWPKPTHGKGTGRPYRTAADCIDWSIPCPSIFERKKPLAENTLRRIARGVQRYVINAAEPFIVQYHSPKRSGDDRTRDLSDPLGTLTTENRFGLVVPTIARIGQTGGGGAYVNDARDPVTTITSKAEHLLVAATLVQTGYGEREGQAPRALDIEAPLGTVVGGGAKHAVVAAFLAQHNTMPDGSVHAGHDMRKPLSTISSKGSQQQLVTSHLVKLRGTCVDGQSADKPMPTITGGGTHVGEVRAFLIHYYSSGGQHGTPAAPMATVPATDRIGLVMVHGEPYQIVDIGMRMLTPRELARAQGFPDSYVIDRGADGVALTKTAQVRMIGNSVCPPLARALILANFASEAKQMFRRAA